MRLKFVLLPIVLSFTFASRASLLDGQCLAQPESKRYLSNNFSQPYPKVISFRCKYECFSQGVFTTIEGISNVKSFSMSDDARKIVCQGVRVKKVSWGFEYDDVEPFFSHNTNIAEIKSWATDNVDVVSEGSRELRNKLYVNLKVVGDSYILAGQQSIEFLEAGQTLLLMQEDELLLKHYLNILNEALLADGLGHELSSEVLILKFLYANARWMLK